MAAAVRKLDELSDDGGLARRIREARLSAGLTQEAVAKALGLTDSAITQWEGGRTRPNRRSLAEFSRLVDRKTSWLLTGVGKPPEGPLVVPKLSWAQATQAPQRGWDTSDPSCEAIQPHHPCSVHAFALTVSIETANAEHQAGDLIIVDPLALPRVMDWVVVVLDGRRSGELALYLPPSDADMARELRAELVAMMEEVSRLQTEAEASPSLVAAVEQLRLRTEKLTGANDIDRQHDFDLGIDNLKTRVSVGPGQSRARIIGVITEHSKRRRS